MLHHVLAAAALVATLCHPTMSSAQTPVEQRDSVNNGVVGVIAARRTGTMTIFADDLQAVLDEEDNLRVLPILGTGSLGNIHDLLYLRGVDIAMTQGDVLDFYKEFNIDKKITSKIAYIASLGLEEAHLLARSDIRTVDDLEGKVVNFGWDGSGSFLSASIIFDVLGLNVEAGIDKHKTAMVKLKNGEIDAMFWMGGAPIDAFEGVSGADGLHLLSIPADRVKATTYSAATLSADQYPNLIQPGEDIETVQVSTVMAAYEWPAGHPRRIAVERFARSLFANSEELNKDQYHPKWKTMDLGAEVAGWRRFEVSSGATN